MTMQVNELPMLLACWVIASTALAATQGDLSRPWGIAGLILALSTLGGLAVVLLRALQAGRVVADAFKDALGVGWRATLTPEVTARLARRRPWVRSLFAPLAVRRRDVLREADLTYGPAGKENLLDAYVPRDGALTGPCLVYFHGGGYYGGRKNREARALIYRLASQGWLCVSANYRLARTAPYPAALVDAKRVIAWVRERAAHYGADPSDVTVAGSSAGAHLAAMTALSPNAAALQPGFEQVDTQVSAAICLYGFYRSPNWVACEPGAPSAPVDHIRPGAPPMLIAHGMRDSFVPASAAREFVSRFRAAAPKSPLVYLELPGAQHTFDLYHSVRFHEVTDAVDAFTGYVASMRSTTPGVGDAIDRDA